MNVQASGGSGAFRLLTVHFNTPELTSSLIRTFPSTTPAGRPVSVHVLDNRSTPGNCCALRDNLEGLSGVQLTMNPENIGFGEGLNQLARSGDFDDKDILWFLNPDTRLQAGCLELLETQIDSSAYAMISPLVYSGEGEESWIWYCGGVVGLRDLRPRHQLFGRSLSDAPTAPFDTEFITGAAPMMRASTFRDVGGFPPGYFLYWEDAYLSWKVRNRGMRLGVVPAAHLWHAVGASSGTGQSPTFHYWFARNRFLFARDIGVPRRRLLMGRGAPETLRIVCKAMVERDDRFAKTRAAVRGTISGSRLDRHVTPTAIEP